MVGVEVRREMERARGTRVMSGGWSSVRASKDALFRQRVLAAGPHPGTPGPDLKALSGGRAPRNRGPLGWGGVVWMVEVGGGTPCAEKTIASSFFFCLPAPFPAILWPPHRPRLKRNHLAILDRGWPRPHSLGAGQEAASKAIVVRIARARARLRALPRLRFLPAQRPALRLRPPPSPGHTSPGVSASVVHAAS